MIIYIPQLNFFINYLFIVKKLYKNTGTDTYAGTFIFTGKKLI